MVIALLLSVGVNIGILATVGTARARAERPEWRSHDRWEGERGAPRVVGLADRLGLDEETKRIFLEQHRQFFDSLQSLRREIGETKEALRQEVGSPSPDLGRIDELLDRSSELNTRMERAFVDNVLAVRQILSTDQQDAYLRLLRRAREQGERGRGRPGERRPRPDPPG
jgi:Spy/CpxP family protein refolding chaperone